jgi:hypothetical protein
MKINFYLMSIIVSSFIMSCEIDKNPIQSEILPPDKGESMNYWEYKTKIIEGQPCNIYYINKMPSSSGWAAAPSWIIDKSKEYLIHSFGESYFKKHLELRSAETIPYEAQSYLKNDKYCISFFYNIKIQDFSTYHIVATYQDSLGNIVRNEGVVDVFSHPLLGMPFNVTDTLAVKTAQSYGLESGISPWKIRFYYFYGDLNKYIWNVKNFLNKYEGKSLIIDSNESVVLKESYWLSDI